MILGFNFRTFSHYTRKLSLYLFSRYIIAYIASSPGLRDEEGLVHTACACATFSVYFTVKVSVKVQVARVHTTEKVYRSSIRRATCLHCSGARARIPRGTYATIVQLCNGYHKSECLSVLWQHSASQALCSSV